MRLVLTGPVIRRRLALCMAIFLGLFAILSVRLFYLQCIAAEDLQRRAQSQWTSESIIRPTRGRILDRNGTVLVTTSYSYDILFDYNDMSDDFVEFNRSILAVVNAMNKGGNHYGTE